LNSAFNVHCTLVSGIVNRARSILLFLIEIG
jgi:hypothetical protein